jgi:putative transposase
MPAVRDSLPIQMRRRDRQQSLPFPPGRGGCRAGAGRRPKPGRRPGVPHRIRPVHLARHPAHVTLRACAAVRSLRAARVFPEVRRAIGAASRSSFRVVHFSVQSDHVHLIVEAADRETMMRGVWGLAVRIARAVNRALRRHGSVWGDRYHVRALRTPREVRSALVYVLQNFRKHLRGVVGIDPCSSASWFDGFRGRGRAVQEDSPVVVARSWLLRIGWRRCGLIALEEAPARGG